MDIFLILYLLFVIASWYTAFINYRYVSGLIEHESILLYNCFKMKTHGNGMGNGNDK